MTERRLRIGTDLITIILLMMLTTAVVGSLLRVGSSDRFTVLLPLGLAGVLCGYLLARYQVSDYLAHSIALWTGLAASLFAATTIQTNAGEIIDTRFGVYNRLLQDLVRSIFSRNGSTIDRDEMLVALGMVAWLVAYTATWIYVRRGWFWLAIIGPAVVMMVALHLDQEQGVWQVSLFMVAAIGLTARNASGGWQGSWARRRIPVTRGLARRLTLLSLPIGAVAVLLAALVTPIAHDFVSTETGSSMRNVWSNTQNSLSSLNPIGSESPSAYNSFDDTVEAGQQLKLGDDIVLTASLNAPKYIRVRSYNVYTGNGWSTDIASTFNADGSNSGSVTKVTYKPNQGVAVSFADLAEEQGTITVVLPINGTVPVIDNFSSAGDEVFALMGWQQIQATYAVNSIDASSVPIDLQALVRAVQGQEFEIDEKTGDVQLTDATAAANFAREQSRVGPYPIQATLGEDNGDLLLTVSGRIPVYDDIERVITKADGGDPGTYDVTGWTSAASLEQLQQAGRDYPVWVTNRYLQLGDSVTQRTRDLATQLVIGLGSPYDQAVAIEDFLRNNFTYEENSPAFDGDMVDHFLFEYQAGRCEQYAAAMVVMLRSVGIPARIVGGYRESTETNDQGEYVYRAKQAHQWVEVFFPEYGWVEFEPTANQAVFDRGSADNQSATAEATVLPDDGTPIPDETPEPSPEPTLESSPIPPALDLPDSSGGGGSTGLLIAGMLAIAAVAGSIAFGLFNWSWKLRGLSPAGSLLYRMQRVGGWFGISPGPSTTPAEYASRFGERFPSSAGAARSISDAYYHEQFGPDEPRPDLTSRAEQGWSRIRTTIWRSPLHRRSRKKGT